MGITLLRGAAVAACVCSRARRTSSVVHDVVALEHLQRAVTRHLHGRDLVDAGRDQILDRRAPEIVEQEAGDAGRRGRVRPRPARVHDHLPVAAVEHVARERGAELV